MSRAASALLCLLAFAASACAPGRDFARVFVAASAKSFVDALVAARGEPDVVVSAASSSTLARQIMNGAPASVFVSAHSEWVDALAADGLVAERRPLAESRIVVVRPHGHSAKLDEFEGLLATGDPEHVPLGRYAKQALQELGLWNDVADRIAPGVDARHALALVETGACEIGIVYATDAKAARERIHIVQELPDDVAVRYEVCLLTGATPRGRAIFEAMTGPVAKEILARQGFVPVD
ncbi:MAG: molybdate ABC transporter substrate-binding protein [Planctomycetes bacterium]|nr:molybdate ABC transporter substrate-binding protein [Planctomycetota bacterium]